MLSKFRLSLPRMNFIWIHFILKVTIKLFSFMFCVCHFEVRFIFQLYFNCIVEVTWRQCIYSVDEALSGEAKKPCCRVTAVVGTLLLSASACTWDSSHELRKLICLRCGWKERKMRHQFKKLFVSHKNCHYGLFTMPTFPCYCVLTNSNQYAAPPWLSR